MVGPLFLYSTSPSPHEQTILTWAGRHQPDRSRPLAAVVMQTALSDPSQAEVDALRAHFCTQDVDVVMDDSGLESRKDAYRPGVVRRLETADLVLITGGSPERLHDCTADTPALHALRIASDRGAVIAGCSAGAIVVGAGMPVGAADDSRPGRFWELIERTLVAPHFGRYDIKPWRSSSTDARSSRSGTNRSTLSPAETRCLNGPGRSTRPRKQGHWRRPPHRPTSSRPAVASRRPASAPRQATRSTGVPAAPYRREPVADVAASRRLFEGPPGRRSPSPARTAESDRSCVNTYP